MWIVKETKEGEERFPNEKKRERPKSEMKSKRK